MKRFKTKKVISEAVKPTPFEFCELCWHALFEWHECRWSKYKFKLYTPVQWTDIYKIVDYSKITLNHTLINRDWTMLLVNLHKDIEFVNWHELIWKEVFRKVKKSLSKKSKW